MLPLALQLGVPIGEFWTLSLDEINAVIENAEKKYENELKTKISLLYELADIIGNRVSIVLSGSDSVELIRKESVHPDLFNISEEELQEEERKRIGRMQAERMRRFAEYWNPTLRQKYGLTQNTSSNRGADQTIKEKS